MLKKRVAILFVVATAIGGCVNMQSGSDFDATKAQTFQKGKTSKTDIITAMGEPSSTGSNTDGSFIEYQHQHLKIDPLASLGIGDVNDKVKLCKFIFDVKNRLKDYTCSEGTPNYSNFGK